MQACLECVANVSEGRDLGVIGAIAAAIRSVSGVRLLSIDRSPAAHRTVFTYAGAPAAVLEAAVAMTRQSLARIDLRQHRGIHPRVGAVDVVPLIPLRGLSLEQTRELALTLSQALAQLGLPIFNYAATATSPERIHLSAIRAGNDQGLAERMASDAAWQPDYGPAKLHPSGGACVVGVRALMLAWNINLNGSERLARRIARRIRSTGNGVKPGRFVGVKALGWHTEDFDQVQVSTNIMDVAAAPMKTVFDSVADLAAQAGATLAGSELIGCLPRAALRHAAQALGFSGASGLVHAAAYLGLGAVKPFDLDQHVLEAALGLTEDLPLQLPS